MMKAQDKTFEQGLAELEAVVEQLERGNLPLEENVGLFERGIKLSEDCKAQLASAESRIQVLLDPERRGGAARAEDLPLDDEDSDGEETDPGEYGDLGEED